ncbi:MAG TPA: hypothetical protein VK923_16465 [Euzebyales bacterium]|nr:hypothetical protein [Euzebyales bacterium]
MTRDHQRGRVPGPLARVLCATMLLAACSTAGETASEADTGAPADTGAEVDTSAATETDAPDDTGSDAGGETEASSEPEVVDVSTDELDPANFDDPATGRNPYLPLIPGQQSVREGSTEVGGRKVPHQVTTTITDVYREIDGVRAVALLDHEIDAGQVTQISVDYMAEDKAGNVWLLGGYTEQYEGGEFVAGVDPWMHGVNGAEAGILVQAGPKPGTPEYSVAKPDREEDEVATVMKVGARHCVPFDCFDDVLVVREGKASAPDNEFKYYARDVGQIDNVPRSDSRHKDIEVMVNLTMLSPEALAESSKEALRLDHNAPKEAPRVFGGLPVGQRG